MSDTLPESDGAPSPSLGGGDPLTSPGSAEADEPRSAPPVNGDAIFRKGEARGRAKLLKDLGFGSQGEVLAWVEARREAEVAAEAEADGAAAAATTDAAAIRKARQELRARDGEMRALTERLARYESQSSTALRAELRGQLVAAGAHPQAVSDLVALLAPTVRWAEDGEGLEVLDGDEPSLKTLDDLIAEQRATRAWFFAPPPQSGSGSQIRASATPGGNGVARRHETWLERVARARSR